MTPHPASAIRADSMTRHATARWIGQPPEGAGHLHSDSRAFEGMLFSVPDGAPEPEETTPGELLAAAYSALLVTYLAQHLDSRGIPARELIVDVSCTLTPPECLPRTIERVEVDVRGRVTEIDHAAFEDAVRTAWNTCVGSLVVSEELPTELRVGLA